MKIVNRAGLSAEALGTLESAVGTLHTLEDVVRWGLTAAPPALVCNVVVQDEFTHDVVQRIAPDRVLVWDCT